MYHVLEKKEKKRKDYHYANQKSIRKLTKTYISSTNKMAQKIIIIIFFFKLQLNVGILDKSQETERLPGNAGCLSKNFSYVILKFAKQPKLPGITLTQTWIFLKAVSYLQVIFMLFWMKWMLVCFNLERNG